VFCQTLSNPRPVLTGDAPIDNSVLVPGNRSTSASVRPFTGRNLHGLASSTTSLYDWIRQQADLEHVGYEPVRRLTPFVYEYGEDLLELLDPTEDERILDLRVWNGSPDGRDSGQRRDGRRTGSVHGDGRRSKIDVSRLRVYLCRRADVRHRRLVRRRVLKRGVALIDDQDAVLESVADALEPDGRFVAELGGAGNVERLTDSVRANSATGGTTSTTRGTSRASVNTHRAWRTTGTKYGTRHCSTDRRRSRERTDSKRGSGCSAITSSSRCQQTNEQR